MVPDIVVMAAGLGPGYKRQHSSRRCRHVKLRQAGGGRRRQAEADVQQGRKRSLMPTFKTILRIQLALSEAKIETIEVLCSKASCKQRFSNAVTFQRRWFEI